jgi:hypothetical protein
MIPTTIPTMPERQAGRAQLPAAPDPADRDLHRLQDHDLTRVVRGAGGRTVRG